MLSRPGVVLISIVLLVLSSAPLAAQQAERKWVVDNSAAGSGDGSPASPFLTLAEAAIAAGEGEIIAVSATGKPYLGGIALKSGQTLIGEGGIPLITGGDEAVIAVTGTSSAVTIANVSLRATGTANAIAVRDTRETVTLRDVAISTAGGIGLFAVKAARLVVRATSVESVDAPALSIDGTDLDATFRGVSARGDRLANGILLQNTIGHIDIDGGTIEGASARAISAINASNVSFRRLRLVRSASVNGVAPADCGGNLVSGSNERCNAAVYLRKVEGALLEGVVIEGSGQSGVVAHDVSGLAVVDVTVRNAGDELFEHGLVLEELRGECRITGTTVEKSASRHLMLHNSRDRLALSIERSKFTDTATPHGQQGVLVTAVGDAAIDLRVRDSVFAHNFSSALEVTGADRSTLVVRVTGSTFDGNASAISLAATQATTLDYFIADNPSITGSENAAIHVYLGTPSTGVLSGTIARNVIGRSGVPHSGAACSSCSGITLSATGQGSLIADVSGNVVQQAGASAIYAAASQGSAQMHLTATANLLREGNPSAPAIRVQSGALAGDSTGVCADIGGTGVKANTVQGVWEPNGAIHLVHRFGGTRFQLAGLAQGKTDAVASAAVSERNGGVKVRAVLRADSMERGFEPAERCTMPALTL